MSFAYHPETDGQTEHVNQCLETYLRCLCFTKPRSWSRWLPLAQWWYNTNFRTAHKRTPFEALFGYAPPIIPAVLHYTPVEISGGHYLHARQDALHIIKRELGLAQQKMKQRADSHCTDCTFEVGDNVYLKVKRFQQHLFHKGPISKISAKYYGPFKIQAKIGNVAYKLQLPLGVGLHPVFHVSLLKPARGITIDTSSEIPDLQEDTDLDVEPQAMLDRRIIYKDSLSITQVLVQWKHLHPDNTTWEYLPDLL